MKSLLSILRDLFQESNMKNKNGFTLIEILVALFIFSIISAITVGVLHTALTVNSRTGENSDRLQQLQIAMILIERDIEQTINRPIIDNSGHQQPALEGKNTDNYIEFTHGGFMNPLAAFQRSTLQRVAYLLNENKLIRRTWPVLDRAPNTQYNDRPLLDNIVNMNIQFLDSENQWHDEWPPNNNASQENDQLPIAVQIHLSIKNWGEITRLFPIQGVAIETQ